MLHCLPPLANTLCTLLQVFAEHRFLLQGTKVNSRGKEVPHGTRLYSIAASRRAGHRMHLVILRIRLDWLAQTLLRRTASVHEHCLHAAKRTSCGNNLFAGKRDMQTIST